MNHREQVGKRISQLRKEKGLTQEQLSAITGLDRANIAKIEKGKYNTGIDIIGKLCDALGYRIDIVEE